MNRRFANELAFKNFLWQHIRESGVEAHREFLWPLINGHVMIDLVVPSASTDQRILFAIECKTSSKQSELQRALGQCVFYRTIDPKHISVCLCMPSSPYGFLPFGLREACELGGVTLLGRVAQTV